MSSVTKNPLYLQSANYIYSYFLGHDEKFNIKLSNTLEITNSDKASVKYLKKEQIRKRYYDPNRYEEVKDECK